MCPCSKWVLLLSKLVFFLLPDSHSFAVPRSERGWRAAADPNYQTVTQSPSFASSITAQYTALIIVRKFQLEPWGGVGGEVNHSTEKLCSGISTEGMKHKTYRVLLFPALNIICIMVRGRKLSVSCNSSLVLPINSEFLSERIAGKGPSLMDKQCSSA